MMEKALKERIIGAIVLVAVVVLVVPVFLDGPPSESEMISERVPLPGQGGQSNQTVVLDRDREDPVPAQSVETTERQTVETPQRDEPAVSQAPPPAVVAKASTERPQPQTTQSESEPERTATPVQSAGSATGMWAVQVGSFSNQESAEKLAADLRKQGFAAFLSQYSSSTGQLHRVRVGPQKDREAADAMATRLQNAGHPVKVLPHP